MIVAALLLALGLGVAMLAYRSAAARRVAELKDVNARLAAALEEKTVAEQATARSEAHFRGGFESAAVGQVHYDPKTGRIIRANRAHAAWLGYEPEELIGRLGSEFTHPEDRDGTFYRELVNRERGDYAREKRYIRKDGTAVWGRVSATVVREPGNEDTLLAVGVIEDIDDRYRSQLALEAAKADLERVVEERTAALVQRDLLLREVYHRVKNNLQIIDSLLLIQSRRLADDDAKAALDSLRSRVYALGLVHHQMMGSQDLETFEIAPFLEELSRHLLDGGGRTGITLTVAAPPLSVGLDFAIPLGLLVTELVTNSMKHAFPDGEGAIKVLLETTPAGRVTLTVTDTGVGYDALSPAKESSLGATIIDGLVRQLHGELRIVRDGGARTVISVPAPGAAVAPEPPPVPVAASA